jgi:hypothetical protein
MRWTRVLASLGALVLTAAPAMAYFDDLTIDARSVAMGSAAGASVIGVGAYYWNPAALASLRRNEVLVDFAKPYGVPDLNDGEIGVAARWHGMGWAFAWHRLAIGSSYAEDQFCLASGRRWLLRGGHSLAGGLTYKLERVSVPTYFDPDLGGDISFSQSKGTVDAGLRWRTPWNVDFSWVGRDLVQPRFELVGGSGGQQQTARAELGAAFRWNPESTILAGWSQYPGGGSSINAGMEILFYDVFAIRSGLVNLNRVYQAYGSPASLQYTGGFGVFHNGYYVDAAVTTDHDLGASYRVSVRLPFGATRRP